jgi:methyl-accepting chemotaxis protein
MLSRFKISLQIGLIGVIALLGFAAVGALYSNSLAKTAENVVAEQGAIEEERLMSELQIDLLGLRRHEKDFFLRMDPKYIASHDSSAKKANGDIEKLISLTEDKAEKDLLLAIQSGVGQYLSAFHKVVDDYKEVGLTKDEGLQGQLRAAVHEIEGVLKKYDDAALKASMLTMRRHEKDFMLREEDKYIEDLKKESANFAKVLEASLLPVEEKPAITKQLDTYVKAFATLAEVTLRKKEDTAKLSSIYREIEPKLSEYIELVQKQYQDIKAQANAEQSEITRFMYISLSGVAVLTILLALLIGRAISGPVVRMTSAMNTLANGNLSASVPDTHRGDEIGQMASAVQVFKDKAIEAEALKEEQKALEIRAASDRQASMNGIADSFERQVMGVINSVSSCATELQGSAESLSAISDRTNRQVVSVAGATEEASFNVQTVAAATEELVSSVSEINRQICATSAKTQEASAEAVRANQVVSELQTTAQEIGAVVTLIDDIAAQTNLLALNATIEAARAGDAGKGFAVVANEVKRLAEQTGKATEEIRGKIGNIQDMANTSAQAVDSIALMVRQASEGANIIASAAEEQGAATAEIAKSINEASNGTREVAENITGVAEASSEAGRMASEVLSASSELSRQSEKLRQEVQSFISGIRN